MHTTEHEPLRLRPHLHAPPGRGDSRVSGSSLATLTPEPNRDAGTF